MTEATQTQTLPLLICPTCEGTGRLKTLSCTNCGGLGLGAFHNDQFLYFSLTLSPALIRLKAAKKTIDAIIHIICYILGVLGLICLGFWLYVHGDIVGAVLNFTPSALKKLSFCKE